MCHQIFGSGYFLECGCLELGKMLMGLKIVGLKSDGGIFPFYQSSKPYKLRKLKNGFKVVDGKSNQPLIFSLNTLNPDKLNDDKFKSSSIAVSYEKDVTAGFHIAHFDTDYLGYEVTHTGNTYIHITPVFFRSEILFYDGNSVSVSSFIIPRPDLLHYEIERVEKIINWNVKQYSFDPFLGEYAKFYTKLGEYYG